MRAFQKIRLLGAFLALLPLDQSLAQSPTASNVQFSRIFSQVLGYAVPAGWKLVNEGPSPDGTRYTINYAPEGATPQNWTEFLSVTGFKGMATDPGNVIEHLARRRRADCPNHSVAVSAGDVMLGARKGNIAIVGCGKISTDFAGLKAEEGEITLHVALAGATDMYAVSWLQRVAAYEPQAQPVTNDLFGQMVSRMMPLGICEFEDTLAQCQSKLGGQK